MALYICNWDSNPHRGPHVTSIITAVLAPACKNTFHDVHVSGSDHSHWVCLVFLVGGFNPCEKYESKWESSPGKDEKNKYLKPPPRFFLGFPHCSATCQWTRKNPRMSKKRFRKDVGNETLTELWYSLTHRIHVWYIYLHLGDFYGKCRQIYHTWILWVRIQSPSETCNGTYILCVLRRWGCTAQSSSKRWARIPRHYTYRSYSKHGKQCTILLNKTYQKTTETRLKIGVVPLSLDDG